MLLAIGISNYLTSGRKKAFNIGAMSLAILALLTASIFLTVQISGFHGFRPYSNIWRPSFLIAGLLFWALSLLFSIRSADYRHKILIYAAAPALFMFAVHYCIPDLSFQRKMPGGFLLTHSDKIQKNSIIVADEALVSSACWCYKRSDVYILGNCGELKYGINYEDSKYRHLDPDNFMNFVIQNKGKGRVTLIAKTKTYKKWKDLFPDPVFEKSNDDNGFVFVQF